MCWSLKKKKKKVLWFKPKLYPWCGHQDVREEMGPPRCRSLLPASSKAVFSPASSLKLASHGGAESLVEDEGKLLPSLLSSCKLILKFATKTLPGVGSGADVSGTSSSSPSFAALCVGVCPGPHSPESESPQPEGLRLTHLCLPKSRSNLAPERALLWYMLNEYANIPGLWWHQVYTLDTCGDPKAMGQCIFYEKYACMAEFW